MVLKSPSRPKKKTKTYPNKKQTQNPNLKLFWSLNNYYEKKNKWTFKNYLLKKMLK